MTQQGARKKKPAASRDVANSAKKRATRKLPAKRRPATEWTPGLRAACRLAAVAGVFCLTYALLFANTLRSRSVSTYGDILRAFVSCARPAAYVAAAFVCLWLALSVAR
jgi:hypothetical protein